MFRKFGALSYKKKRIFFGMLMMFSFISFVLQIYFIMRISESVTDFLLSFFALNNMWLPTVILIGVLYFILMEVYPYVEVDEKTV